MKSSLLLLLVLCAVVVAIERHKPFVCRSARPLNLDIREAREELWRLLYGEHSFEKLQNESYCDRLAFERAYTNDVLYCYLRLENAAALWEEKKPDPATPASGLEDDHRVRVSPPAPTTDLSCPLCALVELIYLTVYSLWQHIPLICFLFVVAVLLGLFAAWESEKSKYPEIVNAPTFAAKAKVVIDALDAAWNHTRERRAAEMRTLEESMTIGAVKTYVANFTEDMHMVRATRNGYTMCKTSDGWEIQFADPLPKDGMIQLIDDMMDKDWGLVVTIVERNDDDAKYVEVVFSASCPVFLTSAKVVSIVPAAPAESEAMKKSQ